MEMHRRYEIKKYNFDLQEDWLTFENTKERKDEQEIELSSNWPKPKNKQSVF